MEDLGTFQIFLNNIGTFAAFGSLWAWYRAEGLWGAGKLVWGIGCYGIIPAISWMVFDRIAFSSPTEWQLWSGWCWNWTLCWEFLGGSLVVWGAVQILRSTEIRGDVFQ